MPVLSTGLSASLHTSAAASGSDPTVAVDVQVQAISTEVHGLVTPRPGFPDNIGAGCATRPLGKFVRIQLLNGESSILFFAPRRR
jgi:hypothetical protein